MNILVAVLLLGFIIIIHELGHFFIAKKNGITVTEFSVGMGPRIASIVKNGTRYSLKLLPFGGSCIMLGEDETVDEEGSFHKKGVWARFSVIFAGAFFNFILAFILALVVIGYIGVDKPTITGTEPGSPAEAAGLQEGDRIIRLNGEKINFSRDINLHFFFSPITEKEVSITYLRDGEKKSAKLIPAKNIDYRLGFTYGNTPTAEILEISEGFPMAVQGVKVGDVIVEVNGTTITDGESLEDYFDANPLELNKPVTLSILHKDETRVITVTPEQEEYYTLGFKYDSSYHKVSPLNAVKNSFYELKFNIKYAIKSLGYLISGRASVKEITGPVGIVNVVGQIVEETSDEGIGVVLLSLASFCILISTNLGVMNLLPIPALDGGRLVFILIEAVRGKPIPKDKEALVHFVGFALLMILMVFVMFNDIRNIFV